MTKPFSMGADAFKSVFIKQSDRVTAGVANLKTAAPERANAHQLKRVRQTFGRFVNRLEQTSRRQSSMDVLTFMPASSRP
jgi:hypothetical protein